MDPNQGGQKPLNPNLQAAYDRVMGLDVSGNATAPTSSPAAQPAPAAQPVAPSTPAMPMSTAQATVLSEPPMPTLPTTPLAPEAPVNTPPTPQLPTTPPATEDTAIPPTAPSMEAINAAMNMPQVIPHDTETVKIGLGGSPVGSSAKPKGKGISPVILIVGAFVFLIIYAIFWVRFFNLPLPFLGK